MPGYGASSAPGVAPYWSAGPNPDTLFQDELRFTKWGRVAVVVLGMYFLWQYVYVRVERSFFRAIGHEYHKIIVATQHHQPVPQFSLPQNANSGIFAYNPVFELVALAAVILACIWQYRAASTARALGFPAKHSPGWGVGSWFVPVVSWWMPYQAIRDCLAPDDPHRSIVKQFWFFLISSQLFSLVAVVLTITSTSAVTVVFSCLGALCCIGIIVTAPRYIRAIAESHQAAVGQPGPGTPMTG